MTTTTTARGHLPIHWDSSRSEKAWNKAAKGAKAIFDVFASVSIFAISAVAFQIFFPPLAAPLFSLAITAAVSRLFIKGIKACHLSSAEKIGQLTMQIESRFPKLRLIIFIFGLAMSLLSPITGALIVGTLGLFYGSLLEALPIHQRRSLIIA